jgi:hypothetical protein
MIWVNNSIEPFPFADQNFYHEKGVLRRGIFLLVRKVHGAK